MSVKRPDGDPPIAIQMPAICFSREQHCYYPLIRIRHARTNFAGQPSIRMWNFCPSGFGRSMGVPFKSVFFSFACFWSVSFDTVSVKPLATGKNEDTGTHRLRNSEGEPVE
jgi:hypothetical protein